MRKSSTLARQYSVCLALLLLAMPSLAAVDADRQALEELRRCRASLDPIVDVGFGRIAQRCPYLAASLAAASWHSWLPADWQQRSESLSGASLAALEALVRDAAVDEPMRAAPDVTALAAALAPLRELASDSLSRWARFKRRLQRLLDTSERDEGGVLTRLSGALSPSAGPARWLTNLGYLLLLGFAGFIVSRELQAAGAMARRRSRPSAMSPPAYAATSPLSLTAIDSLVLRDRPGGLLQLIVARLSQLRGNRSLPALTTQELLAQMGAAELILRSQLALVGRTAEHVQYAAEAPSEDVLKGAELAGRELLATLGRSKPLAVP